MLHEFLSNHRTALIDRCRLKVAQRSSPEASEKILDSGIPVFLDQLIKTLRVEQSGQPMHSRAVSGPAGGVDAVDSEMGEVALRHGRELLMHGFTVEQVVHDYGDLCQSITDLAFEKTAGITIDEFRTLNRCLDNAIAVSVTEYNARRDLLTAGQQTAAVNERLGFLAHELRNHLNTATLALGALRTGNVGLHGATGAVLDRSLVGLRNLIDRSLADVRLGSAAVHSTRRFSLAAFIAEIKMSSGLEAHTRRSTLVVHEVDAVLAVEADRELLASAVGNLLQNAFKFTRAGSLVTLSARACGDRILIEVKDACGGLPEGFAKIAFLPFTQAGTDRSGLGLGLSIAQRSVEANGGILRLRDVPGTGCVFTIDLPRYSVIAPVPEPV